MPIALYTGKPVLAIRNKFVLFFGGYNHEDGDQDIIHIFNVAHQRFRVSKIKCPTKSIYSAVVMSDAECDEKIVFGYIRKQWKLAEIDEHYFPPMYLLQLMASYFLTEFVHILDKRQGTEGSHWRMSTLDIV